MLCLFVDLNQLSYCAFSSSTCLNLGDRKALDNFYFVMLFYCFAVNFTNNRISCFILLAFRFATTSFHFYQIVEKSGH
jgi:hypothetical protein